MIRVLHYGLGANRGGVEAFLLELAQQLTGPLFRFDYVYNDMGEAPCFQGELESLGARFFGLTPRRVSPRRNRAELEGIFGTESFDVLHCHLNSLSYTAPIHAALRHGVPVILHSHNAGASGSAATSTLHRLHTLTTPLDKTTNVAVSKPAGEWLFGKRSKFQIIHNGINIHRFTYDETSRTQARLELELHDSLTVGHVGAFLPAKNHQFLLRIFRELLEMRPDSRLLLIGTGPLEEAARRHAAHLGISERVQFLGRRADVPRLLNAMDALILPSLHEGFPLIALEAQASGLPCFISDNTSVEVIATPHSRRIPLTAPPRDWASAVLETASVRDRELGAEYVTTGGFDAAQTAGAVAAIYKRLATG